MFYLKDRSGPGLFWSNKQLQKDKRFLYPNQPFKSTVKIEAQKQIPTWSYRIVVVVVVLT